MSIFRKKSKDDKSDTPPARINFPKGNTEVRRTGTIVVSKGKVFDGKMARYQFSGIGDGSQKENQKPAFILHAGAILRNVVLAAPAGDGVHCFGSCRLENVWWDDVGEDALTVRKKGKVQVIGGGARSAADKVFQLNAPGGFELIDFYAEGFQRLIRTNGGKNSKDHPYRIAVKGLVAYYGRTIVKSTNSKTRATVSDSDLVKIRAPFIAENGARITEKRNRNYS